MNPADSPGDTQFTLKKSRVIDASGPAYLVHIYPTGPSAGRRTKARSNKQRTKK